MAQAALKQALDSLFADAERELAGLPEPAREGKPLRSLLNHRDGLSVFLDRPRTPMDNNISERLLRGPAIGRRLSFGSDSETGARFTALMYSVIGTPDIERHRRAALADRLADRVCAQRRPAAGRPVALAALVDERGAPARADGAGMTERIECRYYGRDLHRRGNGAARGADRRPAAAEPPCPVQGVLPAHRLVQARRRG